MNRNKQNNNVVRRSNNQSSNRRNNNYQVANRGHNKRTHVRPVPHNFFQGNLVQGMNFGGKDHEVSGYVKRTVTMKDRNGNVQVAQEEQFFNSSREPMEVRVNDRGRKRNGR